MRAIPTVCCMPSIPGGLGEGGSKGALAREFRLDRKTVYRYIGRADAEHGRAGK